MSTVNFWKEPEDSLVFTSDENFDNIDISALKQPFLTPPKSCLVIRKGSNQGDGNMAEFQDPQGNVLSYIDCNGVFHGTFVNDDALGKPSKQYYEQLFFLSYHMGLPVEDAVKLGAAGRDHFIRLFLEQKLKEDDIGGASVEELRRATEGYPSDDDHSMFQGCQGGDCNLNIWYTTQFVQNEKTVEHPGGDSQSWFILGHTPVVAGTMTGTIYRNLTPIQTFFMSSDGTSKLNPVGEETPAVRVDEVTLNCESGEIKLVWNDHAPGVHHAVVSYEYDYSVDA